MKSMLRPQQTLARARPGALVACVIIFCSLAVHAQNYAIDAYQISSGGGGSAGGQYAVSGTISQPDAGKSSGGGYALEGGFWSIVSVIQTPGAPVLSLTRSGGNVILSWSADVTGFQLEDTTTVATPASWQNVSGNIVVSGGQNTVTLPLSAGYHFYRLRKP